MKLASNTTWVPKIRFFDARISCPKGWLNSYHIIICTHYHVNETRQEQSSSSSRTWATELSGSLSPHCTATSIKIFSVGSMVATWSTIVILITCPSPSRGRRSRPSMSGTGSLSASVERTAALVHTSHWANGNGCRGGKVERLPTNAFAHLVQPAHLHLRTQRREKGSRVLAMSPERSLDCMHGLHDWRGEHTYASPCPHNLSFTPSNPFNLPSQKKKESKNKTKQHMTLSRFKQSQNTKKQPNKTTTQSENQTHQKNKTKTTSNDIDNFCVVCGVWSTRWMKMSMCAHARVCGVWRVAWCGVARCLLFGNSICPQRRGPQGRSRDGGAQATIWPCPRAYPQPRQNWCSWRWPHQLSSRYEAHLARFLGRCPLAVCGRFGRGPQTSSATSRAVSLFMMRATPSACSLVTAGAGVMLSITRAGVSKATAGAGTTSSITGAGSSWGTAGVGVAFLVSGVGAV